MTFTSFVLLWRRLTFLGSNTKPAATCCNLLHSRRAEQVHAASPVHVYYLRARYDGDIFPRAVNRAARGRDGAEITNKTRTNICGEEKREDLGMIGSLCSTAVKAPPAPGGSRPARSRRDPRRYRSLRLLPAGSVSIAALFFQGLFEAC